MLIAATNTLTGRLAENGDVGDRSRAVLEEWAIFMNQAITHHGAAVSSIVSTRKETIN